MSERSVWRVAALLLGLLWSVGPVGAYAPLDHPESSEPRVPGGKVIESAGLVASPGVGEPYQRVRTGEEVYTRDLLMVLPGLKAVIEPRPKSVLLTLAGNLPGLSDSPVLESAITIHDSRTYDLDISIIRGRYIIKNNKEKGAAKIWLRTRSGVEFTLPEPGDEAALEVYGRWPAGVPFRLKPRPDEAPVVFWDLLVLKGNLDIKWGKNAWSMSAPPGPSYFHGDSVTGPDASGPQRRAKVPAWADSEAPQPEEAKLVRAVVDKYREVMKSRSELEAGAEMLAAAIKDKTDRGREARRMWVHAMAAMDNIELVADSLGDSRFEDMRKSAVVALRHWIGANAGRDEKLYYVLVENLAYSKAEAATVMQLLHSPFVADQPETYETLIAYLKHSKVAVRELAAWHLYRLAPAGRKIKYNAAGTVKELEAAAEAWKTLIPAGDLPPAPKEEKKEEKEKGGKKGKG